MLRAALLTGVLLLSTAAGAFEHVRAEDAPAASPCAGVWQMAGDGALFIITDDAAHPGTLRLEMLMAPDFSIAPHTVFGTMHPAATPGSFDAALRLRKGFFKRHLRPDAVTKAKVSITGGMAAIEPYKSGWTVDLLRIIPYLWRASVRKNEPNASGLLGAQRIAPEPVGGITIL